MRNVRQPNGESEYSIGKRKDTFGNAQAIRHINITEQSRGALDELMMERKS